MTFRPLSFAPILLATLLAACSDDNNPVGAAPSASVAVIAARAADYSSGAHNLISLDNNSVVANLDPGASDLAIRADGEVFYRIARFGTDSISRYSAESPAAPIYTYSTQDANDTTSSNPYDILSVSPDKAYLLRYGASALWVVDPAASSEGDFRTGTIDLSSFDADGVPEMSAIASAAGLVFVTLQRLSNFEAIFPSLLIAIDPATDTLVDLDPSSDGVALELPVHNATDIRVRTSGSDLLVLGQGSGQFNSDFTQYNPAYNGGIATVSLSDYSTQLLLDDGGPGNAPYDQFMSVTEQADGTIWLVAGDSNFGGTQSLYRVDESSQSANNSGLPAETQNHQISTLAVSPVNDLWLGIADTATAGVLRFDPQSGITNHIALELIPIAIDFAQGTTNATH